MRCGWAWRRWSRAMRKVPVCTKGPWAICSVAVWRWRWKISTSVSKTCKPVARPSTSNRRHWRTSNCIWRKSPASWATPASRAAGWRRNGGSPVTPRWLHWRWRATRAKSCRRPPPTNRPAPARTCCAKACWKSAAKPRRCRRRAACTPSRAAPIPAASCMVCWNGRRTKVSLRLAMRRFAIRSRGAARCVAGKSGSTR
ncbi:hypothetical protein D3C78_1160080 [compost metagenome]